MQLINVYDFDGTIYDGDSSVDFFLFCLWKGKVNIIVILKILINIPLYLLKIKSTKEFKEIFFSFLKKLNNSEDLVQKFWQQKQNKIKQEFISILQKNTNNYIITASPEFLIKPPAEKYECQCIGTNMDIKTGKIKGENCHKEEKVNRLNKVLSKYQIKEFYSDSSKDLPLARLALKKYFVKKNKISKWQ